MNQPAVPGQTTTEGMAKVVYILYLVGIVFGITAIVGVVIAYVFMGDAPDWLRSHYRFQVRTFWIGLLYVFVGGLLTVLFVGYLVLAFAVVWLIIRCVRGLKYLDRRDFHPDPAGWLF